MSGQVCDPEAARVCGLNDISVKQHQLVTLRQLRAALDTAIHELEREHSHEQLVNRAFMVVRFTKATCDAFLGMAQGFVEAFVPAAETGAKTVNTWYAVGTTLGDAVGTKIAGGKVDYTKTGLGLAKAGTSRIDDEGYELLAKSMIVKGEVVHAALNSEKDEVTKKAAEYVADLNVTVAKMALKQSGHIKTKKAVGLFADIAKNAFDYNEALGKVFDAMIESQEEGDQRYLALRGTLLKQARRVSTQIATLERSLGTAGKPVPDRTP